MLIIYRSDCDPSHSSDTNVPIICVGTLVLNLCRYNFKYMRLNNVILIFNKIFSNLDNLMVKKIIFSKILIAYLFYNDTEYFFFMYSVI